MNSAFPRISHPVSSDSRRSRINGVFPTYPSMPAYVALIRRQGLALSLSCSCSCSNPSQSLKPPLSFRQFLRRDVEQSRCCSITCPERSLFPLRIQLERPTGHFSSQARPSVIIFTPLPPPSGFTKIVSSASPRLRFSIAEAGVIRSLPSLVQPCALRFADNSAQALFTFALLLNPSCSTSALYSTSDASLVSARSFAFN